MRGDEKRRVGTAPTWGFGNCADLKKS